MSRFLFPEDITKISQDISNKRSSLKSINKHLKLDDLDAYNFKLNEQYKISKEDLNQVFHVPCHAKIIEFLTKCATDDLNSEKLLEVPIDDHNNFDKFSLSKETFQNHVDRVAILSSISHVKEEIKLKKEKLLKLKDHNKREINPAVGLRARVKCLNGELEVIRQDISVVQDGTDEIMQLVQNLKSSAISFRIYEDKIKRYENSANEDSKTISTQIKMCQQKCIEISHQIKAVEGLFLSISDMFSSSSDSIKAINMISDDKLAHEDVHFDHLGTAHNKSKMYNLMTSVLNDHREKSELSAILDGIESSKTDYQDEYKTINKLYKRAIEYTPILNGEVAKILELSFGYEQEIKNDIARIQKVFNEWSALRDAVKK